ncbi:MAG TPA: sensor domain-containing diguanylate cyclase [Solirubrobacteraceae bacterium]
MNRAIASVRAAGAIRSEERVAAGRVGAIIWVIASLSVIAMALVLPLADTHRGALVAMGVAGCAWGTVSGALLDYGRLPVWLIHLSAIAGTASIAAAIGLSGGARSPAWACLFYVVVFAAYFFRPAAAVVYFVACVAVDVVVVITASAGAQADGTGRLVVAGPAFIVLGSAIVIGKRFMWTLRRRAQRLAAEQGAMRRVATAVVSGEPAAAFYELVSLEAGQLLEASGAGILRLDEPDAAIILGSWAQRPELQYEVGARFPVAPGSELAQALSAGRPRRVRDYAPDSNLGALGYASSIVSPVRVAGRTWGFLAVVSFEPAGLTDEHELRLTEFGELIASAVTNIEDRAALAAQAATDALTGVANHRAFHERLTADLARARRHRTPLSVAMIDIDHFKRVNDAGGHEAGDEILIAVARTLGQAARAEDTLARVGGDEFAWILPETGGEEARIAVQRARDLLAGSGDPASRVTISAGVCDSTRTSDPTELVRLADRALYSSKDNGRDQVRLYAPTGAGAGDELAAH